VSGKDAFLGIDVGSISTKAAILDGDHHLLANAYIWTEGNPIAAVKKLLGLLEKQVDPAALEIVGVGVTGSARQLVGAIVGATVVKNEITAHAVGTTSFHPEVRTILEIGGQDSKIILVENGVAIDYAMNTLCAAGTGAFLSSQARRLGIAVEEMGDWALKSTHPTLIAARCTVFAESDLVHKIQMGHPREDIIAGVCKAVASNYINNVAKGKKILSPVVFQGGVSKNTGVVRAFEEILQCPVLVDENGHLMGAIGAAILAKRSPKRTRFDFSVGNMEFITREQNCDGCSNHCEVIRVYRNGELIDSWGNRCERGAVRIGPDSRDIFCPRARSGVAAK